MSLSRDFLLTVRIFFSISSFSRWEDYQLMINRDIYNKIQIFVLINRNNSGKNSKGFRVKRNDTDYFFKVNKEEDLLQENNIINT